jgi:type IV pilus assembly protein PilM
MENEGQREEKEQSAAKERTVVGVALGADAVRMVKLKTVGGRRRLESWRTEALLPGMAVGTRAYREFLEKALKSFCRGERGVWVYAALQNVDVAVRNLSVPEVPANLLDETVYWALKREVEFTDETHIFDYELAALDEEENATEKRIAVMAYAAPREPVAQIREAFEACGLPARGITFPFFAVRNLFTSGWISSEGKPVAFLYVGAESSRITVYEGRNMPSSRAIKLGVSSLLAAIREGTSDRLTAAETRRILYSLGIDNPPLKEGEAGYGLTPDQILEMLRPTLRRMVRQIERTLHYCSTQLGVERVEEIFVSGELSGCEMAVYELREQIKSDLFLINPFESGTNALSDEGPVSISERALMAVAAGAATWDEKRTPDLLNTCRDRAARRKTALTNRVLLGCFAAAALLLGAWFWSQQARLAEARGLRSRRVAELGPSLSLPDLELEAAKVVRRAGELRAYARRFHGATALGELSRLTPEWVRLTRVRMDLAEAGAAPGVRSVAIEGTLAGEPGTLPARMAEFVVALENSPFFEDVSGTDREVGKADDGRSLLRFGIEAGFAPRGEKEAKP